MCGTILHACVLVWGCAGDGRVLAVPAAGAGDMDNYSVSLSAGPSMQVLTTAPSQCHSVSLTAGPGRFYHGGLCAHSETSTTEAQHGYRAGRGPHAHAQARNVPGLNTCSHTPDSVSSVFAPTED